MQIYALFLKISANLASLSEKNPGFCPWISQLLQYAAGDLPYTDTAGLCRASAHNANHVATLRKTLEGYIPASGKAILENLHPVAKHIEDLYADKGLLGHSDSQDIVAEGHVQPSSLTSHKGFGFLRT